MRLVFEQQALEDLQYWVDQDRKISKRILKLIEHIQRDPCSGIGKPEKLKHTLSGLWSRRVTQEHRLVYCVKDNELVVYSCRYHY